MADQLEDAANYIEQLEQALKEIRDSTEKRMVMGFNFQTGKYPLTEDTVQTLLWERDEARQRIEELGAEKAILEQVVDKLQKIVDDFKDAYRASN